MYMHVCDTLTNWEPCTLVLVCAAALMYPEALFREIHDEFQVRNNLPVAIGNRKEIIHGSRSCTQAVKKPRYVIDIQGHGQGDSLVRE